MTLSAKRIAEIATAFPAARVVVVGDFMADVYLDAAPERLSREAPVLVVRWEGERRIPGGAANAVNNLAALGARTGAAGVVGDDVAGRALAACFAERGVDCTGLRLEVGGETVSKTRVMVGAEGRSRQQVLRIDREPSRPPRPETREELRRALPDLLADADAIVLSDYGYGVLDRALVEAVLAVAGDRIVVGDSRYDLPMMRGVSIAKPNHAEAEALVGHPVVSEEECRRAGPRLLEMLDVGALLLTRGNRGMMLLERGEEPVFIPAADLPGEVTDVSGAGDTVVSLLALSLAAGADYREAAELSNIGAGVVVGKLGAATVSPTELVDAAMRIGG